MKIKKIGWTSFLITSNELNIVTDPVLLKESGASFPKVETDVCLFTECDIPSEGGVLEKYSLQEKVVSGKRGDIMEIFSPGEFEVGGVMIRRGLNEDFYIIDEKNLRTLYMGIVRKDFDPESVKNLGDVDALIVPVGNGEDYVDYEKLDKIISNVDPAVLIPCAYKGERKNSEGLKSREEFIKHFGYTNITDEGFVNLKKKRVEEDQKSVEVVFLK